MRSFKEIKYLKRKRCQKYLHHYFLYSSKSSKIPYGVFKSCCATLMSSKILSEILRRLSNNPTYPPNSPKSWYFASVIHVCSVWVWFKSFKWSNFYFRYNSIYQRNNYAVLLLLWKTKLKIIIKHDSSWERNVKLMVGRTARRFL